MTIDAFAHHPGLRDQIVDPETSFYRTLTTEVIRGLLAENGIDSRTATLVDLGGPEAAAALKQGTVDAAFFYHIGGFDDRPRSNFRARHPPYQFRARRGLSASSSLSLPGDAAERRD